MPKGRHRYLSDILSRCPNLRELVFEDVHAVTPREALMIRQGCPMLETVCGFIDITGAHLLADRLKHMSVSVPKVCGRSPRVGPLDICETTSVTLSVTPNGGPSQWTAAKHFLKTMPTLTDLCLSSPESTQMRDILSVVPNGVSTLGILGKIRLDSLESSSLEPLWDVRFLALYGEIANFKNGDYFQHVLFAVPQLKELRIYSEVVDRVVALPMYLESLMVQRPLTSMIPCPSVKRITMIDPPSWAEMIELSRSYPNLKSLRINDVANRHCNVMNALSLYGGWFPHIETLEVTVLNNFYVGTFDNIKDLTLTCKYVIFGNQENSLRRLTLYEGKACATTDECKYDNMREIHLGAKGNACFDFIKGCVNLELITLVRAYDYGDDKIEEDIRYYCNARGFKTSRWEIEVPPNPKKETMTVGISFRKSLVAICFSVGGLPYMPAIVFHKNTVVPAPAEE